MDRFSKEAGTEVWAYCLMPNHVHLVMVPKEEDGLRVVLGEVHRRYTRYVNFREGWRGHLWQERIRRHSQTGRPLGEEKFVTRLEALTGRQLASQNPGRKSAEWK